MDETRAAHNPLPTARELDALSEIVRHIGEWGFPPTVRELGDRLGVSHQTAHRHLSELRGKGLVVVEPDDYRAIAVTLQGWRVLGREVPACLPVIDLG